MIFLSRATENTPYAGLCRLLVVITLLCGANASLTKAEDIQFKAQLIWGTDEEKPKDNPKIKDLDDKLRDKLKNSNLLRWKNFFQIDQESFKVPEKGSKITCVSQKCVIEVTHLGSFVFSMEDLKSPHGFFAKLRQPSDPVSVYLKERLSETTRKELAAFKPAVEHRSLNAILVDDFNKILMGQNIYDARRFAGVKLQPEAAQLLKKNPQGKDLVRLNRLLLEDAYPNEMEKNLHLDGCMVEVKLYGEGKLFNSTKQNLPLNEYIVLGGKVMDKQSDAWLVAISRKEVKD